VRALPRHGGPVLKIRAYRPGDRPALDEICIRTAAAGQDATGDYDDPRILPEIFAAPYAYLEPELTFVLTEETDTAVGYILGTSDTEKFAARFRTEWLPGVADRYPPLAPGQEPRTNDEIMRRLLHEPERMIIPELAGYPAHLHIDLLPAYQRSGWGRQLIETFLQALRRNGVPGVHLGMVTANTPARAFYDRLGFHVLEVRDPGPLTYLGMRVASGS
jgi:ribosomal protein S18 acetylase RimI-like enzyme